MDDLPRIQESNHPKYFIFNYSLMLAERVLYSTSTSSSLSQKYTELRAPTTLMPAMVQLNLDITIQADGQKGARFMCTVLCYFVTKSDLLFLSPIL